MNLERIKLTAFFDELEKISSARWRKYISHNIGDIAKLREFILKTRGERIPGELRMVYYKVPEVYKFNRHALGIEQIPDKQLEPLVKRIISKLNESLEGHKTLKTKLFKKPRYMPWPRYGYDKNLDPDTYIDIVHGGTKEFLGRFIAKKQKGYLIDTLIDIETRAIRGIMVSPLKGREKAYAIRAAVNTGETPAMLTGKIKAKYLLAVENYYEAGLPGYNINKIKDLKISNIKVTKQELLSSFPLGT